MIQIILKLIQYKLYKNKNDGSCDDQDHYGDSNWELQSDYSCCNHDDEDVYLTVNHYKTGTAISVCGQEGPTAKPVNTNSLLLLNNSSNLSFSSKPVVKA